MNILYFTKFFSLLAAILFLKGNLYFSVNYERLTDDRQTNQLTDQQTNQLTYQQTDMRVHWEAADICTFQKVTGG